MEVVEPEMKDSIEQELLDQINSRFTIIVQTNESATKLLQKSKNFVLWSLNLKRFCHMYIYNSDENDLLYENQYILFPKYIIDAPIELPIFSEYEFDKNEFLIIFNLDNEKFEGYKENKDHYTIRIVFNPNYIGEYDEQKACADFTASEENNKLSWISSMCSKILLSSYVIAFVCGTIALFNK
jgi:hypothetical protein